MQWKSGEKILLELKKKFHEKLFLVSAFKKTGTSAELGPTSAFSRITTSTPDFPHVQVLYALVVPKASVGPETKQPPYSAMWGSTAEIPRRLHISPSLKLYSLSVHSPHPSLSQASPYLFHSKGCRNLLFHSWQNSPHPFPLHPFFSKLGVCVPPHTPRLAPTSSRYVSPTFPSFGPCVLLTLPEEGA